MENFIKVDIFYQELKYELVKEKPAVELGNLLGELGGSLGLFLGASLLTFVEIFDFILLHIVDRCGKKKPMKPMISQ